MFTEEYINKLHNTPRKSQANVLSSGNFLANPISEAEERRARQKEEYRREMQRDMQMREAHKRSRTRPPESMMPSAAMRSPERVIASPTPPVSYPPRGFFQEPLIPEITSHPSNNYPSPSNFPPAPPVNNYPPTGSFPSTNLSKVDQYHNANANTNSNSSLPGLGEYENRRQLNLQKQAQWREELQKQVLEKQYRNEQEKLRRIMTERMEEERISKQLREVPAPPSFPKHIEMPVQSRKFPEESKSPKPAHFQVESRPISKTPVIRARVNTFSEQHDDIQLIIDKLRREASKISNENDEVFDSINKFKEETAKRQVTPIISPPAIAVPYIKYEEPAIPMIIKPKIERAPSMPNLRGESVFVTNFHPTSPVHSPSAWSSNTFTEPNAPANSHPNSPSDCRPPSKGDKSSLSFANVGRQVVYSRDSHQMSMYSVNEADTTQEHLSKLDRILQGAQ